MKLLYPDNYRGIRENFIKLASSFWADADCFEFGVFEGGSLKIISMANPDKLIYAFDSFQGLLEDWAIDDQLIETYSKGKFAISEKMAKNLLEINNVCYVIGDIKITLNKFIKNFCFNNKRIFCHIDVDTYETTLAILKVFKQILDNNKITIIFLFDEFYYQGKICAEGKAFYETFGNHKEYDYIGIPANINNVKKIYTELSIFESVKTELQECIKISSI